MTGNERHLSVSGSASCAVRQPGSRGKINGGGYDKSDRMVMSLFQRRRDPNIAALYGAIVAQARQPAFYNGYGVADTVDGRFDMLVLHLALVIRRLRARASDRHDLAQALFDSFCTDMDRNLREMGVGDLAVPKRMRAMGEAFYGRAAAYDQALAATDDTALIAALCRNVFAGSAAGEAHGGRLAAYVRRANAALAAQDIAALLNGDTRFPQPADLADMEVR
jgi:cytochrome b pre-mRNA-processing protein 3